MIETTGEASGRCPTRKIRLAFLEDVHDGGRVGGDRRGVDQEDQVACRRDIL